MPHKKTARCGGGFLICEISRGDYRLPCGATAEESGVGEVAGF
jgi:hypothetical protein